MNPKIYNPLKKIFVLALVTLLTACASPISTKVTRFNQWPTDAASATFNFIRPTDAQNDLERQSYEKTVQVELERFGLVRAPVGQVGRFQVDLITGNGTRSRSYREPIYRDNYVFLPPYRDTAGNVLSGFWAPDRFGSRHLGDRTVIRTLQVSNLRLRLLDLQGAAGKPKAVFESRAVYEGDIEELTQLMPYLVRAALDGFPGKNGTVQTIRFDPKTGALLAN